MKPTNRTNLIATTAVFVVSLLFPMNVIAADTDGNFSVRGFGSISCQDFISLVEANDTDALIAHSHWLQGYFSAHNRKSAEAYDTVPVYRAEDILTLVRSVCEQIPEQPVESAANASVRLFERAHLSADSKLITVENDGRQATIREGVIAQMQQALADMGHYDSVVDGLFGRNTAAAISRYQRETNLPETGLPDLATLVEIFTD